MIYIISGADSACETSILKSFCLSSPQSLLRCFQRMYIVFTPDPPFLALLTLHLAFKLL